MGYWVGFDFDGTLVEFPRAGQSHGGDIPSMVRLLRELVEQGVEVRIVTAKAAYPELTAVVQRWLDSHGIGGVKITDRKDFEMVALFDDLAISVEKGIGTIKTDMDYANRLLSLVGMSIVVDSGNARRHDVQ